MVKTNSVSPADGWTKHATLRNGTKVLLRPIQPADEQLWLEMIESCSPDSIHRRFGCLFIKPTHEMAEHYCDDDYWNEMAVVAIVGDTEAAQMIGVGRLVADRDQRDAEFALLVSDDWQGFGVGSLLMDDCLENCPRWGVQRVFAEVAPTNERMLGMFRRRGFELDYSVSPDVVLCRTVVPTVHEVPETT